MERIDLGTPDLTQENIEKLGELFPQVMTEVEGKDGEIKQAVDFDALRDLLGDVAEGGRERYQFTWPGKREAKAEARRPIAKTMRPCPEESVNWDTTENLYIEGDNLDALKILKETYAGKVKMIYIDPPYNTGKNYIYKNNFSLEKADWDAISGDYDEYGGRMVVNPETNGRFHSDWLSMIYQRLPIARDLLSADGIFVCAIDENEFGSLSLILKEFFSEKSYEHSYVSVVHNPRGQQGKNFSYVNEYWIFIYPKDGRKYIADFPKDEIDSRNLRDSGTESDRTDARNCFYPFHVRNGKIVGIGEVPDDTYHPESANVVVGDVVEVWPISEAGEEKKWRYARQTVESILGKLEPKQGRSSVQIIFNKDEGTMRSVWAGARYDASEYGTKVLDKLLGGSSFTFPKSLWGVYDAVVAATKFDKDAVVVDFFSGSATTAHAVMQRNLDDCGNRKFIMVQHPTECDLALPSGEAFSSICEIGKERIRRAGKKIAEEIAEANKQLKLGEEPKRVPDIGFRVMKIESSNFNDVSLAPDETSQQMLLDFSDNLKDGRSDLDILFEVLPKFRIPYSAKIEEIDVCGKRCFNVEDGELVACFDKNVGIDAIEEIAKMQPLYAVLRDASMADDATHANFEELFKVYSPDTVRRVI